MILNKSQGCFANWSIVLIWRSFSFLSLVLFPSYSFSLSLSRSLALSFLHRIVLHINTKYIMTSILYDTIQYGSLCILHSQRCSVLYMRPQWNTGSSWYRILWFSVKDYNFHRNRRAVNAFPFMLSIGKKCVWLGMYNKNKSGRQKLNSYKTIRLTERCDEKGWNSF